MGRSLYLSDLVLIHTYISIYMDTPPQSVGGMEAPPKSFGCIGAPPESFWVWMLHPKALGYGCSTQKLWGVDAGLRLALSRVYHRQ